MTKEHSVLSYIEQLELIIKDINNGSIFEKIKKMRDFTISNYTEEEIVNKTLDVYNQLEF